MSLYHEAATFLQPDSNQTLAARLYASKDLKCKYSNLYALTSQTYKWSSILSKIVEKSEILKLERKLSPALALLLSHDLLLSKSGIAASKDHALRLAIERHKARLSAEFTKARIRAGAASVEAWRAVIQDGTEPASLPSKQQNDCKTHAHPRWIRINNLKASIDTELSTTFSGYDNNVPLAKVLTASSSDKLIARDSHIPSLFALPPSTNLAKTQSYLVGRIILQDKASCFPAYLLDPQPSDGDIIDACAAPGNKTTHLAALLTSSRETHGAQLGRQTIFACERDKARSLTLEKMIKTAGASIDHLVCCLPAQDFMRLNPSKSMFGNIGALLLDPSCSGSGIVGRDEAKKETLPLLVLPRTPAQIVLDAESSRLSGKKRKRHETDKPERKMERLAVSPTKFESDPGDVVGVSEHKSLPDRLEALSAFQLSLLKHAFSFSSARKVVYSTCSVHAEENEQVVLRALSSKIARETGWRVCKREEQVDGMRRWQVRGDGDAVRDFMQSGHNDLALDFVQATTEEDMEEIAQACLKCEKGTSEGTMGFFAVKFVRWLKGDDDDPEVDDWSGFSDDEAGEGEIIHEKGRTW